jgi:hypothetical protein
MSNEREVNVSDEDEVIVSEEVTKQLDPKLEQEPESSTGGGAGIEPETTDEVASEEKSEEEEVEPEKADIPAEPLEPKPVEGETPREYALRKEVERLREKNRDIIKNGVFGKAKAPVQDEVDISDLLAEGYTEQEIESSKKLISKLAPSLGFVNKQQTYQETANQELDKFVEEHPEYLPKNDKDDIRWNKFIEVITTDYNLSNQTPKQLKAIYEKVDRDVKEEFGESKTIDDGKKIKAQVQKVQSVSHTGGNKSIAEVKKSNSEVKEANGVKFIGFDDDDLK